MNKRTPLFASILFGLLSTLITVVPAWSELAFTRYKYGAWSSPWCCYTIYAQDYDCQGRIIPSPYNPQGKGCYNTGSGDYIYGTCGGGCVMPACGGIPTKICVIDQPNIGCGNCNVFLHPLPGSPPSNCTSQVDPACNGGCMWWPSGRSCYTVPYDATVDMDSGYLCDRRTPAMIASGCRPEAISSCLSIESFSAEATPINSSGGQGANLTGVISVAPGGSINWSISVAGRIFTGSGDSLSVFWDGKDAGGKQVLPGIYPANLQVHSSGGSCRAADYKNTSISITANQPDPDSWPACVAGLELNE